MARAGQKEAYANGLESKKARVNDTTRFPAPHGVCRRPVHARRKQCAEHAQQNGNRHHVLRDGQAFPGHI
jgi:hypothetical protein